MLSRSKAKRAVMAAVVAAAVGASGAATADAATVTRTDDTAADFTAGTQNGTVVRADGRERRGRDRPHARASVRRGRSRAADRLDVHAVGRRRRRDRRAAARCSSTARAPTAARPPVPGSSLSSSAPTLGAAAVPARRLRRRTSTRPPWAMFSTGCATRWRRAVRRASDGVGGAPRSTSKRLAGADGPAPRLPDRLDGDRLRLLRRRRLVAPCQAFVLPGPLHGRRERLRPPARGGVSRSTPPRSR